MKKATVPAWYDDLLYARQAVATGRALAIREANGASTIEFATLVGAGGPSTIWRWERGDRVPHGQVGARYGALLRHLEERSRATA